jgi:hypothetical protein
LSESLVLQRRLTIRCLRIATDHPLRRKSPTQLSSLLRRFEPALSLRQRTKWRHKARMQQSSAPCRT